MIEKDFPKTLPEFNARFSTEEDCQQYLEKVKWPKGYKCRKCANDHFHNIKCRHTYQCSKCGHQQSLISGTIFENGKKPLMCWFLAIFHVTNTRGGLSAKALQRLLGFGSYQTAWTWLHKIREAMSRGKKKKLTDETEVDETYWGSASFGKTGRGSRGKTLIGCAVEKNDRGLGRIRLKKIDSASASNLDRFIQDCIKKKSVINTDGWQGYTNVDSMGYDHFVTPWPEEDLTGSHLVTSLLKRWLLGTHQGAIRAKHFDAYLNEFAFRFNRRKAKSVCHCFQRVLENLVQGKPKVYWQIIGRESANKPLSLAA